MQSIRGIKVRVCALGSGDSSGWAGCSSYGCDSGYFSCTPCKWLSAAGALVVQCSLGYCKVGVLDNSNISVGILFILIPKFISKRYFLIHYRENYPNWLSYKLNFVPKRFLPWYNHFFYVFLIVHSYFMAVYSISNLPMQISGNYHKTSQLIYHFVITSCHFNILSILELIICLVIWLIIKFLITRTEYIIVPF